MPGMLDARALKGKGQSLMAVMQDSHERPREARG
jgi:hypothetical protein